MHGRTKSVPALESYDGNWVISNSSRTDQAIYSIPKSVELKKPRNGEYEFNSHSTGERSNGGGERYRIIKESRTGGYGVNQATRRLNNRNRYNRHRSADRLHDEYTFTTTDGHHARSLALRDSAFEGQRRPRQVVLRNSDGDFGFTMRQIPSAMYGRKSESSFVPKPAVPALQRLNIVEPGSLAYKAGLRPGDYILEINGEYVARSSHLDVVHLIKNSGKTLTIKVIEGAKDNVNERQQQQQHSNASPRNRHRVRYADKTDANNNTISRSRDRENGHETLQRGRHRTTVDTGSPVPSSSRGFSQPDPISRTLQKPPTVANIRLSRTAANDQVFYVSNGGRGGRTGSPHSSASTLTLTNGRRLSPPPPPPSTRMTSGSSSSVASIKSHPTSHRKRYQKNFGATSSSTSGDVTRLRRRDVIHEVPNEAVPTPTGNDEDLQSVSELKLDDVAYTYDVIRPRDVPFETDEGYIGLQEKVDYVDESAQEAEKINFLEIAERVRQLYLRSKSISQAQQ